MVTEFCQKCKQSHPGRLCDYDDKGECGETVDIERETSTTGSGGAALSDVAPSSGPKDQ